MGFFRDLRGAERLRAAGRLRRRVVVVFFARVLRRFFATGLAFRVVVRLDVLAFLRAGFFVARFLVAFFFATFFRPFLLGFTLVTLYVRAGIS